MSAESHGKWGVAVTAACAIYLLADFFFLTSNRFNEHTVYVTLSIAIAMLLTAHYPVAGPSSRVATFICGLFAGSTVTFIYIYSMPVAVALGATIFFVHLRQGFYKLVIHVLVFGLGAATAIGLFASFPALRLCDGPFILFRDDERDWHAWNNPANGY